MHATEVEMRYGRCDGGYDDKKSLDCLSCPRERQIDGTRNESDELP